MISQLLVLSVSIMHLGAAAPSPQAKAAFDRAEKALANNQLKDAEAGYREAIKATAGYAPALNGLGSVLFKQGQHADAIAQFRAAIDADPKFALAYYNLGYAARKTSDFQTAATAYETYTKLKPEDPDGFYGLGESYKGLGQNANAIAAYEQFIAREKRPAEQKWVQRAKDTVAQLKSQPAAPAAAPAPSGTGTATAQPSAPGPAGTAGGTAQPELARKKIAEGDQAMAQKKYREASFAYQDAVNAAPSNVEALFKLGNSYAVLGYYSQAIERWNQVAQLTPDAAVRKSAQENITKAQAKMAQAGGGTPQSQGKTPGSGPVAAPTRQQARAAYEEGVRQINARDFNSAVKSLTQAIQLEPNLAVAYVARGSAFIGLRRFADAAADYQYANRLDPNLSSPLYGMAEAYRGMGRAADARSYYDRYAQSNASDVRPELQAQAREKASKLR